MVKWCAAALLLASAILLGSAQFAAASHEAPPKLICERTTFEGDLSGDPVAQEVLSNIDKARDPSGDPANRHGTHAQNHTAAYEVAPCTHVSLSGDLSGDPVAQEILRKIDESRALEEKLRKQGIEAKERQKELTLIRSAILQNLVDDPRNWAEISRHYENDTDIGWMIRSSLGDHPARDTEFVSDHPVKLVVSKIYSGDAAMAAVLGGGGTDAEARDAFAHGAQISRAEMLFANSIANVLAGDAYYGQQMLFDPDGTFDLAKYGRALKLYYQDFRADPKYLHANPLDRDSWNALKKIKGARDD